MQPRIILTLVLSTILVCNLFASDTLSHYDPSTVNTLYFKSVTYSKQLARFDLPMPGSIKGINFKLDGNANETFKFTIVGQEGGVMLPSLFNPFFDPILVTKPNNGKEDVYVELTNELYLANNQFFILMEDISTDLKILSDRKNHDVSCQSNSGGFFYYQYVFRESDKTWYLPPGNTNKAFGIDVIIDYNEVEKQVFKDFTTNGGFELTHSNASIAAADYNNDGNTDMLIRGQFYENKYGLFTNITSTKGIKNQYSGISANAFIDIDNDADLDIILFGGDTSVLFVNNNGAFTEQILNLPEFKALLSFNFADVNFDGFPDLFVSQLWKTYPEAEPNRFFLNDGANGFTDATKNFYPKWDGTWNYPDKQWYVDHNTQQYLIEKNRNSRGSQFVDFDNDGDLDLYVSNYFLHKDELFQNDGNGKFTDIIDSKNIDVTKPGTAQEGANHGTGVDWYDYDADGDMDLLLPQFAHPRFITDYDHRGTTIYQNQGAPGYNFTDLVGQYNDYKGLKSDIGLELEETHAGGAWGDINNDGLADFLMTVFYGCRYIDFYEQQPDHTFKLKTYEYGLEGINTGTDIVWFDANADGRLDLAGAENGKFRLFLNDKWNGNSFVGITLNCTSGNKFAIGARVNVFAGGKEFMQEVSAGRGQKMQKPYRLHFGLDKANSIDSIVVLWPTKPQKRETFTGISINKFYILKEGQGAILSVNNATISNTFEVYPNPILKQLNIKLNLTSASYVKIELLNNLGQVVEVISEQQFAPEASIISWRKAPHFSKGLYFVRISVKDQTTTQKVIFE